MKFKMYLLRPVIIVISFIITLISCQSGDQKEQEAVSDVQDAQQNLKEVAKENNEEKIETATADDWKRFKDETDAKIQANEKRMSDLVDQMKLKGKKLDDFYAKQIDTLQMKNKELKSRIDSYEVNKSDWKKFQQEFNRDMDELGKSLKDFTVNNKK
jgi:hypothetical protein